MKNSLRRVTGFTLTELVVVIVIAGILSAVVYNKVDVNSFKAEGSTDEVKAALRYAQKLAIAQRRNVYITASSTNVCVGYDATCTPANRVKKPATTAIALTFASRTVNVEPQTGFVH